MKILITGAAGFIGMHTAKRLLDLERVKGLMKGRAFIDLRNVYEPESMAAQGFEYTCVGR